MNITDFKSALSQNGLARNNTWLCTINPPSSISKSLETLYSSMRAFTTPSTPAEISANRPELLSNSQNSTLVNVNSSIRALRLYATSCTIPSRDMRNIEFREYGETRFGAFLSTHKDLVVSFYCSEDLRERLFFELWQDSIFNPKNKQQSYYDNYARNASISIDKYSTGWQNITASYRFNEAYPTNVGALPLNYEGVDVLRLDVTFKYRNYERIA